MIALTDEAQEKVLALLKEEQSSDLMLRVAVRPGGCSGFSYEMFFDSKKEENDIVTQYGECVVVSDPSSASLLEGATLNYKSGLNGGFDIVNPNAQRTCGCGQSFS